MAVVTFTEFKRLDIRVVRVIAAKQIPGRSRILKLSVDVGQGELRDMVAGGAEHYSPEDFVNRKFIALVNLAPKSIAGFESQGMLLATDTQPPLWLSVSDAAPVGSRII